MTEPEEDPFHTPAPAPRGGDSGETGRTRTEGSEESVEESKVPEEGFTFIPSTYDGPLGVLDDDALDLMKTGHRSDEVMAEIAARAKKKKDEEDDRKRVLADLQRASTAAREMARRTRRDARKKTERAIIAHVWREWLGLEDTHEFPTWLMTESFDLITFVTLDVETAKACGYDIPYPIARKMQFVGHWFYENELDKEPIDDHMEQTFVDMAEEDFKEYVAEVVKRQYSATKPDDESISSKTSLPTGSDPLTRGDTKSAPTTTSPPDAPAGPGSMAAILMARRKSVSFGLGSTPTVTTPAPTPVPTTTSTTTTPVTTHVTAPVPPITTAAGTAASVPPTGTTVPIGAPGAPVPILVQYPKSSRASEFDKAGRRSSADYPKFSNREGWKKWNRSLIGTAYEHKCENVLKPGFLPDVTDPDACELFANQQRFMYSVFTKCLTEPKATDILRTYSNPSNADFGDAQRIYTDLVDYFEGGAQARVSALELEEKLTGMRLNRQWNKTVTQFITTVAHLIRDHKELTEHRHNDTYYIEKLEATLKDHKDMAEHIQTLKTQDAMLRRRVGTTLKPMEYAGVLHELTEYATVLDDRYKYAQAARRGANVAEQGRGRGQPGRGGRGGGRFSGRGIPGRGRGRGRGGQFQQTQQSLPGPAYVSPNEWFNMSQQDRTRILNERRAARSRTASQAQVQGDGESTIAGPPTTIQVNQTQGQQPTGQTQNRPQGTQGTTNQPGSMLRQMMSQASQRAANAQTRQNTDELTVDGTVYRRVNKMHMKYRVSLKGGDEDPDGGLVDGGANGGLCGDDARMLEYVEGTKVDVTGVGKSEIDDLKVGLGAAVTETMHDGPVVILMGQYADLGEGKTIHSKGQMEHFGALVDDTSRSAGGRQMIVTSEGYCIPIHIRDGLPRIDMRPPTDEELETLPHVYLTSDSPWDPSVLDNEYDEDFYDAVQEDPDVVSRRETRDPRVDGHGFLRKREDYHALFKAQDEFIRAQTATLTPHEEIFYDASSTAISYMDPFGYNMPNATTEPETRLERTVRNLTALPNRLKRAFPDLDKLKPYFGWASNERLKMMLDKTTQHYRGVVHYPFRKHFKTRFPAANVPRLNEWMATDTFFCDTPAADDGIPGHGGCTMMQIYTGLVSGAVHGFPMKSEKEVAETMEDLIRKVGAPIGMRSDNAKAEIHGRTKDIMRMYEIDDKQSEPYYQHQNPAERKIQDVKKTMNSIMDRTGCPTKW